MEQTFQQLMEILKNERDVIEELVLLARQQTEVLKENDVEGLFKVVGKQEQAGSKLAEIEKERLVLEKRLAEQFSFDTKEVSLNDLIKAAGTGVPNGIRSLAEALKNRCQQLQLLNETNKLLVKQSLSYINKMLSALLPQQESTYKNSGVVKHTATVASTLDQTV